jgi:two-component system, NarL family, sensor histidine kinase DesK
MTRLRQRLISHFFALVWLLFMAFPIVSFVNSNPSPAALASGLLAAAVFMALYAWLWVRLFDRWPKEGVLLACGSLFVIALLLTLTNGLIWGALFVYVIAAIAGHFKNWRHGIVATVAVTIVMSAIALLQGAGIWTFAIALEGLLVGSVVVASTFLGRTNRALSQAKEDLAQLRVAEERLRFARDLHDLLGHSLSVIVLKAELAGKLATVSPDRVATEVADIERVARQALADVRDAAAGYREASLSMEIEQARSALAAAGITVEIEELRDGLPAPTENVLAWALREGVTNVIRHADASAAKISLARRDGKAELDLTDDGHGAVDFRPGNGLTGIRERVAGRQGEVEFGPALDGGFRLHVSVPL